MTPERRYVGLVLGKVYRGGDLYTPGLHRVYWGTQKPIIGTECPGVAKPNVVVGYRDYDPAA